jgi:hypothetical protein
LTDGGKRQIWDPITKFSKNTGYCHDTISAAWLHIDRQNFAEVVESYTDSDRQKENKADVRNVRDHATWAAKFPGVCHLIQTYGIKRGQEQDWFWSGFNYACWLAERYIPDPKRLGRRVLNHESHPSTDELREIVAGTLVISSSGRLVSRR